MSKYELKHNNIISETRRQLLKWTSPVIMAVTLPVHAQTSSATTQPPGGTTTQPPGGTTTQPPGGTTTQPPGGTTTQPPGGTTTTTTTTTTPEPSCPPISFGPGTPVNGCIEVSNDGRMTLATGCALGNNLNAEWQCAGNSPQSPNIGTVTDNGDGTFSFSVTGSISFAPGGECDLVIFESGMEIGRQCYRRV